MTNKKFAVIASVIDKRADRNGVRTYKVVDRIGGLTQDLADKIHRFTAGGGRRIDVVSDSDYQKGSTFSSQW